ncbi:uncharacterized protein N7484_007539 [Penicillium longicatenatum]|uniref:uncharacterized protein n=1 Tax=Penicillium longicatenatum TaxID=1561947 RepID=UPI002549B4BF|nr:uncharacterized protein N7484_007539 [Penicillium longicatenatum]KAJ5639677.1 hypothetical protein N7484_007539 [Penicillium longicatenatum]
MANPNLQGRAGHNLPSPPSTDSPLSPASAGSNPISFRTNVNRSKTKRWVEAKQYSYDGGDWGDEDDEEEEEEAPPDCAPTSICNAKNWQLIRVELQAPTVDASTDQQKAAPFVRPADLYKRMHEKTPTGSPQLGTPPISLQPGSQLQNADSISTLSEPAQNAPAVGLPDIKRMSAFGTDFLDSGDSIVQPTSTETREPTLQHNPSQASQASEASQGFTSVVHQAFDVPETPNSTAGSVARSNSDGTSVISPIISNRGPQDRTPTIPEEPAESSTPTGALNDVPAFIPGHRRDLSVPSRDNSPSKKPILTEQEPPSEGQAELSSISPGQTPLPPQPLDGTTPAAENFVAPLKFGERKMSEQSGSDGYRGSIPTIIPASNIDSPEDGDNDRLREEIIRSLSREGSQEPDHIPQAEETKEDSIPHQYEKYWDGQTGPGTETPKALVSESHPDWTNSHPLGSQDPYGTHQTPAESSLVEEAPQKPRLGRRFSWESSSSTGQPTQAPSGGNAPLSSQPAVPLPEDPAAHAPESVDRELPAYDSECSDSLRVEKPRLSIVPPIPENSAPPVQVMGPVDGQGPQTSAHSMPVGTLSIDENKLQGFRDILNITSAGERTKAFDNTRDQFSALNSGLNHWLQITIHDHPEHADLVYSSQSVSGIPRNSPIRSRFPKKLASIGNLTTPKEDGDPTSASHVRRPSGNIGTIMNKSNVEQRGKEFLHTAGTFGGKAGEAAKGFFAKGRSKFRAGGDKDQSSTSRPRSLHFGLQSESNSSQGNSSFRRSVNLGSLPVFKFGQNKNTSAPSGDNAQDVHRSGKRFKSTGSMDLQGFQTDLEGTSGRAVSQPLQPLSSDEDRSRKANARNSGMVSDLEQEMIAALGLSPTKPLPDPLANADPALPFSAPDGRLQGTPRPPSNNDHGVAEEDNMHSNQPSSGEKSLPVLPVRESNGLVFPGARNSSTEPVLGLPHILIPSIRPVIETESASPPTTPLEAVSPSDIPPATPPKDLAPPKEGHTRQRSVSTLGADERNKNDQQDDTPPSPLQPPSPETDDSIYGKALPQNKTSTSSLPSAEEISPGFVPVPLPRPATSAEVLDAKRRSISGLPPSAPNMQSPLRNEVRYSPANRSSMLSFGSWGRQSNNSRGTRPPTPANEISSRIETNSSAQNGESKMDKLKSFGKRRRASVGDLLSGIQGGLRGLQEKISQPEPQEKEKTHQRKRSFSMLSNFFTRSESQPPVDLKNSHPTSAAGESEDKDLPASPLIDRTHLSGSQGGHENSAELAPSETPAAKFESSRRLSSDSASRQRASIHLPPSASANALASGRFYSQAPSTDYPPSTQHTRVKSLPLISQPLSSIPHSESNNNGFVDSQPWGPGGQVSQEEQLVRQSSEGAHDSPKAVKEFEEQSSQPVKSALKPNVSIKSRKPIDTQPESTVTIEPKNIAVSGMSTITLSEHPHRDETKTFNRNSEPVELALKDDDSDEIVMSPTAYPGQEWAPMHM